VLGLVAATEHDASGPDGDHDDGHRSPDEPGGDVPRPRRSRP
jgi:hypothetical protein